MRDFVSVGLGGFLGAVLRYGLSGLVQQMTGSFQFPFGTLSVNVIGSFTIAFLAFSAESLGLFGPTFRAFVLIGLLGAFTTFSSFSFETLALLGDGELSLALGNIVASVGLCLLAAWAGRVAVIWIWS